MLYGKLPIAAPPWLGQAHRAAGGLALLLAVFVAYHCLWALGLEYGHLHNGEKVGARTVVHGLLGCAVFGAIAVKVAAVRAKKAPGWFLPVAGGLLFSLFILIVLTSAGWYYVNYGWPDSDSYEPPSPALVEEGAPAPVSKPLKPTLGPAGRSHRVFETVAATAGEEGALAPVRNR